MHLLYCPQHEGLQKSGIFVVILNHFVPQFLLEHQLGSLSIFGICFLQLEPEVSSKHEFFFKKTTLGNPMTNVILDPLPLIFLPKVIIKKKLLCVHFSWSLPSKVQLPIAVCQTLPGIELQFQ